jgi:hypothetical protein
MSQTMTFMQRNEQTWFDALLLCRARGLGHSLLSKVGSRND